MAKVTIVSYNAAGAVLATERCDEMSAYDIQQEMIADEDCDRVECLEDDPAYTQVQVYAFGD